MSIEAERPSFETGLGFLLARLGSMVESAWSEVLSEHDLTNAQYNVLAVLAEFGPQNQADVAKRVAVDPRNVVKTVAALTGRGLVSAEVTRADGRAKTLRITNPGRGALEAFTDQLPSQRSTFTRVLSPEEELELTRLVRKLYADHAGG